jgi:hypothetical protein
MGDPNTVLLKRLAKFLDFHAYSSNHQSDFSTDLGVSLNLWIQKNASTHSRRYRDLVTHWEIYGGRGGRMIVTVTIEDGNSIHLTDGTPRLDRVVHTEAEFEEAIDAYFANGTEPQMPRGGRFDFFRPEDMR